MNKPAFDPNQPFEVAGKPKFDPSQPFEEKKEGSFLGINRKNLPQTISSFARPALEMGGAVVGAALASPGIVTTPAGGALGLAGGIGAANFVDRMLGVKKPIQNVPQAIGETGSNLMQGTMGELTGQVMGPVLGALKRPLSKFAGNVGRTMSGVKSEAGQRLFNDPGALLSPSVAKSGAELGAVRNRMGLTNKPTIDDVVDSEASNARKMVKLVAEKVKRGKAKAIDLLKGVQALDDIIEATPMRQKGKRRLQFEQKREWSERLGQVAGPEREAARQYSRSALGSEFRKVLPVTKYGDVSVLRSFGLPAFGAGGAVAAGLRPELLGVLAAQSPITSGVGIASTGALYKALQNPTVRRALIAAMQR